MGLLLRPLCLPSDLMRQRRRQLTKSTSHGNTADSTDAEVRWVEGGEREPG